MHKLKFVIEGSHTCTYSKFSYKQEKKEESLIRWPQKGIFKTRNSC